MESILDVKVIVSLAAVFITCCVLLLLRRNQHAAHSVSRGGKLANAKGLKSQKSIVVAGPSHSGKTTLFTRLTTESFRSCVLSQEPSIKHDYLPGHTNLLEFPGHVKLRYKLFDFLKGNKNVKGVVYVVDSTVDLKELTNTAEFLVDVLNVTENSNPAIDVLIACNKFDFFTARPPAKIKQAIEREIGHIITRKKKSLNEVKKNGNSEDVDGGDSDDEEDSLPLFSQVQYSGSFNFEQLEGTVEFISGSAMKNKVDGWCDWMSELS
ncbi:Signal recognition particle receptor subunit beta KNAG_0F03280 [Huiozyma naganishii CBS 8797]|uniref:Signal recognition particle receptor subunit beta n=1 Tax=Huiozyma naganishii (strain ATCC MYA-139 / BCRC 22969 / CBS 8797 / KCTC 17520 / NBRC 10181 / NCYC 3082 / Yp74L-3) TaxID=1071383 RepID=J7R820_HUIN7|nr:hypothetical protein KNAG_0F03280 [Kazachstania naganishii CBS 8797]CCK70990.1 hypothetical protein KNAG_0F03280 [Kazachstania naganishii CBS 8797]